MQSLPPEPDKSIANDARQPVIKRPLRALTALLLLALLPMLACAAPWRGEATADPSPTPAAVAPTESLPSDPAPTETWPAEPVPAGTEDDERRTGTPSSTFIELLPSPPESLNPVLTTDPASLDIQRIFLPALVTLDPASGAVRPALAASWQWGADNLTLLLTLRTDLTWSDGTPVTALDAGYTLAALLSPAVQSPWAAQVGTLAEISMPSESQLFIRQRAPDCALLAQLRLPLLPSHLFAADFSDLRSNPWNGSPTVGVGPFLFANSISGAELALTARPQWPGDAPLVESVIFRFESNEIARATSVAEGAAQRARLVAPSGQGAVAGVTVQPVSTDGMSMLLLNLADPLEPEPGISPAGVLQPQQPHPLLAELRVREAIARGVDWPAIVRAAYGATAAPQATWLPPALAWAHDETVSLPPFDPQAAATLLEQAGWTDSAGDGVREKGDALLQLTLITNDDNPARVAVAQQAGEALRALGFDVRVELLPFDLARDAVLGQRYDLAIAGWEALGPEPTGMDFWHSRGDVPGEGPNLTSYQNPALDALLDEARTLPGCDEAARADRYRTVQQVLAQELPAIPLNTQMEFRALASGWESLPASVWAPYAGLAPPLSLQPLSPATGP